MASTQIDRRACAEPTIRRKPSRLERPPKPSWSRDTRRAALPARRLCTESPYNAGRPRARVLLATGAGFIDSSAELTLRATHLSGPRPFFRRRSTLLLLAVAAAAAATGTAVAVHYHRAGLTLSHYDARGHLVVARRVIDSLTPGWQQIGAVWLPLPHLLNLIPVQIDAMYRSGASAVVISVASYAAAAAAVAWIVLLLTGCAPASQPQYWRGIRTSCTCSRRR